MAKLLWIEIDAHAVPDHEQNCVQIWVKDEQGSRVDLLNDPKRAIKDKFRRWARQAILRQLTERCAIEVTQDTDENDEYIMVHSGRKDMVQISQWTDLNATLENFQCAKGTHKYEKDKHLANELKTVIAGSATAGGRLKAMGVIDSDRCPHCGDEEVRLTTHHMFWSCKYH